MRREKGNERNPSELNSKKQDKKSTKKAYKLPSSLEAAFAAVIAQNAVILSHPVIDFAKNGRITVIHYFIFTFALVNCFIVITNWVTCKTYYRANAVLFCNDIITLTIIATIANVASGMFDPDSGIFNEQFFFLLSGTYYIIIHILYIWWNSIVTASIGKKEKALFKKQNIQNLTSIALSSILIIFSLFKVFPILCYISYTICVIYWIYILIMFTRTFNIPMQ